MHRAAVSLLVLLVGVTGQGVAQAPPTRVYTPVFTPPPGSALRVALMDAMRPQIQALMGVEVKFVVSALQVSGSDALFYGRPVHRDGREFSAEEEERAFRGEVYDGVDPMMAWLVRRGGRWTMYSLLINQSDVGGMVEWCRNPRVRRLMQDVWSCDRYGR